MTSEPQNSDEYGTVEPIDGEHWALTACGMWECGGCHKIVTETHFYRDRMTGEMGHEANPKTRKDKAARCGWSYNYDGGGGPMRCVSGDHPWSKSHDPGVPGYGGFSSTSWGVRPPAPEHFDGDVR